MTYATQASKLGKEGVQIVEITMDRCARTYGTAPCTAAIGTTGTRKCFNTFSSCQDSAHYLAAPVVYRFATTRLEGLQQPGDFPTIPTLLNCSTAPTVLTPAKGIGIRSSVKITLQDHPWTDIGIDPYRSTRGLGDVDAFGSFWGRFVARNRYYTGRKLVVKTGFLTDAGGYDPANFVSRTYLITKISAPDSSGKVCIEAKDPLRFADSEKVKFPIPSTATLGFDITFSDTSAVITDPGGMVLAALASGQPYLRIDKEIVLVSAYSVAGTTITATIARAGSPSSLPSFYDLASNPGVAHSAGAAIQQTYYFNNAKAYDIVNKLLGSTVAGLPVGYLPLATWTAEFEPAFSYMTFSRLIAEPVGVKDLLTELTEHGLLIWWDERSAVVKLRPMRFYATLSNVLNDTANIINDSVSVAEDPNSLATQVWITYALAAPLEDPKLLKSYRAAVIKADLDAESANGYGSPSVRTVYSRWMPLNRAGDAQSMAQTMLRQFSKIRRTISWSLDPKDDVNWVGDVIALKTYLIQDDQGQPATLNVLITSVEEVWAADGLTLQYVGTEQFTFGRVGLITPNSMVDYSAATAAQRERYAFAARNIPAASPTFADGNPAYQVI